MKPSVHTYMYLMQLFRFYADIETKVINKQRCHRLEFLTPIDQFVSVVHYSLFMKLASLIHHFRMAFFMKCYLKYMITLILYWRHKNTYYHLHSCGKRFAFWGQFGADEYRRRMNVEIPSSTW